MKYFEWDEKKNEWLKEMRSVSFERVIMAIIDGKEFGRVDHPNQKRYPGQKMYVVEIDEHAFVVPFVEDKEKLFLKTIYPSRKYTKQFVEKGDV